MRIAIIADLDWTAFPNWPILIALFTISRVLFLNAGFGLDADAWRIANTAYDLNNSHVYHASRSFGFPLPELVDSLVIDYGWVATNSLTMILSLISVIFLAKILNEWKVESKGIIVLAYCFIPILWINSTNSMDYMWALTFILLSWFSVLKENYLMAGIMLGLAIGSRMTSVVFVLPLLYLISCRASFVRDALSLISGTALTSAILFLPVFLQSGAEFLPGNAIGLDMVRSVLLAGNYLGILPIALILAVLLKSGRKLIQEVWSRNRITIFLCLSILLFLIVYFIAPHELGYLIPIIPFGLLLLGRIGGRMLTGLLCASLVLSSFVVLPSISPMDEGLMVQDFKDRTEQIEMTQELIDADLIHAAIVVGWYLPCIVYLDENDTVNSGEAVWDPSKDVWYCYLLPIEDLRSYQDEGYAILYIEGMKQFTEEVHGYDLDEQGAEYLEI